MRIQLYIKQAWNQIRQERLYSTIYLVGTGLAISLVMVLSIVLYVKFAPLYPDIHRDRELVLKYGCYYSNEGKSMMSACLSRPLIETCFDSLDGVEAVAICKESGREDYVQPDDRPNQIRVSKCLINPDFWQVYAFRFLAGKPFSAAEFESGVPVAVITHRLARQLFGETDVVGREISLHFHRFRVVGVVEACSPLMETCYADVYIPFTTQQETSSGSYGVGPYQAIALVKREASLSQVKAEVDERLRRFSLALEKGCRFTTHGGPDPFWQSIFRRSSNAAPDIQAELFQYGVVLLLLLLIPAVSLSGMADSRMNRHRLELGVRRAFGAPCSTLFMQILVENLLYTLLGGLLGLLISFGLVELVKGWLFSSTMSFDSPGAWSAIELPAASLLNPTVFVIAIVVCFVLNFLSAAIPAWRGSRRPIVESLNQQK